MEKVFTTDILKWAGYYSQLNLDALMDMRLIYGEPKNDEDGKSFWLVPEHEKLELRDMLQGEAWIFALAEEESFNG